MDIVALIQKRIDHHRDLLAKAEARLKLRREQICENISSMELSASNMAASSTELFFAERTVATETAIISELQMLAMVVEDA